MRRSLTPALVLAGALTAGLVGCSPSGDASSPETGETMANTVLHPTGEPGLWLDDAYGNGSVVPYATPNDFCGATENLSIERQRGPGFTTTVQARDMRDGSVMWEIADAGCSAQSVRAGELLLAPGYSGDGAWAFVDAATGKTVQELDIDASLRTGRVVTEVDGIRVIEAERRLLIGVAASGVVWQHDMSGGEVTPLGDGALGIADGLDERIEVLDGRTGEQRSERTGVKTGKFDWASDGYVLNINESDPEYAYFDFDGAEVDRTKQHSVYGFTPKPRDGATFSIDDFLVAEKVTAVAHDGRPALYDTGYEDYATMAGAIDELPGSGMLMVRAVSASGSLLLFPDDATDSYVMIDASGAEVLRWPTHASTEVRVESGRIVLKQGNTTTVLLPGL